MIDNITVGKAIAKLRQGRGMTQQQLAAALNVSHQAVSKWENGAALPDVQTLMNLTQLFGVTVEQLLSGNVPEERDAAPYRNPIEEGIQNIGAFVNDLVNGLTGAGKPEQPEKTGREETGPAADPDGDGADPEQPEEDREGADGQAEPFDLDNLLRMAPFMSKPAVEKLLMAHREGLTAGYIAKFAPFIGRECLEQLIQNPETEITWDTLRRIAPFLKREMVDRLAGAAARGEKLVQEADRACRTPEDLGRSIGEVSQRIGSGVEKALRKAAKLGGDAMNEAGKALNDIFEGMRSREERAADLRRAAMERAIQDEKWDWIAAHIDDLNDEEMKCKAARKANAAGMHDWVLEHLQGYVDTDAIDKAIEAGNWGWLGEHIWQFEPELQQRIALAAVRAEHWLWLTGYAEILNLEDSAAQVAKAAYDAGERGLAQTLAQGMSAGQLEALANDIVAAGDDVFLEQLAPELSQSYLSRLCLARAQGGNWDSALRFAPMAGPDAIEHLMALAISEGDFDVIDKLNPML